MSKRPSTSDKAQAKRRLQFSVGDQAEPGADISIIEPAAPPEQANTNPTAHFDDPEVEAHAGASDAAAQESMMIREQDRFLPIANVSRIMKRVLPDAGKVAKEAKECVQECVSEFISFITSEASERCMHEKRKTINGEDLLCAMHTLGFEPYVEPLKVYLSKYRLSCKGDRGVSSAMAFAEMSALGGDTSVLTDQQDTGDPEETSADGNLYVSEGQQFVLSTSNDHHHQPRQYRLAQTANGQLALIDAGEHEGGILEQGDSGSSGQALTMPVLSGSQNQQYILAGLDGSGQQFAIPAGAQLAFLPAASSGNASSSGQGQILFLDSSTAGATAGSQSPQYITVNSGNGHLQIIQLPTATHVLGATNSAGPSQGNTSGNSDLS